MTNRRIYVRMFLCQKIDVNGNVNRLCLHRDVALAPEAIGDVLERAVHQLAVEALISGGRLERTEVLDVRTNLDVVKVLLVDHRGNADATAVPCHMELRMVLVDVLRQLVDAARVGIAAHEGDAGDVGTILRHEVVDGIGIERHADVVPEVTAVTPRTVTRAIRDVNCQCHLVGYLLEYNACIYVFQHNIKAVANSSLFTITFYLTQRERRNGGQPLPGGAVRSC